MDAKKPDLSLLTCPVLKHTPIRGDTGEISLRNKQSVSSILVVLEYQGYI